MANLSFSWRDAEVGTVVDTTSLDSLFDEESRQQLLAESDEEVASLKSALVA